MRENREYLGSKVCTSSDQINKEEKTYFDGRTWDELDQEEKEKVWQKNADKQQKKKKHMDVGSVSFQEENSDNGGNKDNVVEVDFSKGRE